MAAHSPLQRGYAFLQDRHSGVRETGVNMARSLHVEEGGGRIRVRKDVGSGLVDGNRLGAGRLAWKRVASIQRKAFFFVLKGNADGPPEPGELLDRDLRFLLVDQLERLVLMVMEKSPNIRMGD